MPRRQAPCPRPARSKQWRGRASFLRERADGFDGHLHLLVAEHDGTEHDVFGQAIGLRLHHQHRVLRAGDDEVELRLLQLCGRRVQNILAVLVADARRADRAHERQSGQRQAAEAPSSDGISGSISVFIDKHRRDDLHVASVTRREQRPNRSIDEPGGQRLLLARAAFALEEAAGNLAGRVGLLLIVDREREEVASCYVLLVADRGDEHHGVGHVDEDGSVRLTGDGAGFDRDLVRTVLERSAGFHFSCP